MRFLRNEIGMAVSPLNYGDAVAENVIVESKLEHGLALIEPVEIEVVNWNATLLVLVHEDEGRAGHIRIASQTGHEAFYKLRFPSAEVSLQGKHIARTRAAGVVASNRPRFFRAIGNEHSPQAISNDE